MECPMTNDALGKTGNHTGPKAAPAPADAPGHSPATARRRLRAELRRRREAAGLSPTDVVSKLDWSHSKLIRIENGSVGISVTDARALLSLYGSPVGDDGALINLARGSRVRTWWSGHREVLSPHQHEFLGFETDARRLRQFHAATVPGLLQTEEYIRALLPALSPQPQPESTYDGLVAVRLRRQVELLSGDDRPGITFVIDEAALRRPVGGPVVMRRQLEQLTAVQIQEQVEIAVLPFAAGAHIGMAGAFHLMDFADEQDSSIVYLEGVGGELVVRDNPDVVAGYARHYEQLLERCHTGTAALDTLIRLTAALGADGQAARR
jgi:transcriptional regulator with XRE-family HTH domain